MTTPMSLKKYTVCFAYIFLGFLGALTITEVILHITDTNDYEKITNDSISGLLRYRPNSSFIEASSCFQNNVSINNDGFHANTFPRSKIPGTFRVVIIGGSFVEAKQVPIDQMLSTKLESLLNSKPNKKYTYEVIPIGFSGNGTFLNLLYYMRYGSALKPDLVIDLTTEYEIGRNAPDALYAPHFDSHGNLITSLPKESQDSKTVLVKNMFRKSKLLMNMFNRYTLFKAAWADFLSQLTFFTNVKNSSGAPSTSNVLNSEWTIESKLLIEFNRRVQADRGQFLVVSWASPDASSSTAEALPEHLTQITAQAHFSYADLAPAIAVESQHTGKNPVWSCDNHWNSLGQQYAAEAIYLYLVDNPKLIEL